MISGYIANYFHDRGFGFIKTDDGKQVFFHRNAVEGDKNSIRRGVVVDLEIEHQADGKVRASTVRLTQRKREFEKQRPRQTKRLKPYTGATLELGDDERSLALREIAQWKVEAKLEDIKRYFYRVPELDDILSGHASYVIGRKGTGKTALVEYLSEQASDEILTTKLTFKNFPFNELYSQTNSSYTRPNQYITIWKLIIYSAICRKIADDPRCDPLVKRTIDKAFPPVESDNLGTIVERWISGEFGLTVLGTGGRLGGLAKKKSPATLQQKVENLEAFVKKHSPRKTILVMFDELDEDYKEIFETFQKSNYLDLLTSLFKAVQDVKSSFRGQISSPQPIIFLRDDIYDLLQDPDKNKWTDLEVHIKWSHREIKELIALRLSKVMNSHEQDFDTLWYSIFTRKPLEYSNSNKHISCFDYMNMSAQGRPRDYIAYLKECAAIERRRSNREIDTDTVKDADKQFSNYLRKELRDEVHGILPEIDKIFSIFSELRKWILPIHEFKAAYEERVSAGLIENRDVDFVLRTLFYFSIIGNVARVGVHIFRHEKPSAQLNFKENIVVHRGLMKALQIL
ncbi:cold shock domain-containing protein [Erythrobacter sp. A30-3]|nr:cold shock domain-containing protein [Erythrobacter sp. A30-3]